MAIHVGSIWLDRNWAQLPQDSWVAANQHGIVVQAKDLAQVYASLNQMNIDLDDVTIAYIPDGVIQ